MNVVFTTILGGCDSLKRAPTGVDRAVCLVDDLSLFPDPMGWELFQIDVAAGADPRRLAWRLRALPDQTFDEYSRVIWIDASFTLIDAAALLRDAGDAPIAALRHHNRASVYDEARELVKVGSARKQDIDPQMEAYRKDGYPDSHLSISCVIVRDHSKAVGRFNETWAREFDMHRGDNTQLSLDYSAWANGLEIKALQGTRHANPYSTHDHADHKKRRKPYRVPA